MHKRGSVSAEHGAAARQTDRLMQNVTRPGWADQVFGWAHNVGRFWEPVKKPQLPLETAVQRSELEDRLVAEKLAPSITKEGKGPMLTQGVEHL